MNERWNLNMSQDDDITLGFGRLRKHLTQALRYERTKRGMRVEEFSDLLGISADQYGSLVDGKWDVENLLQSLERLGYRFNVKVAAPTCTV